MVLGCVGHARRQRNVGVTLVIPGLRTSLARIVDGGRGGT
jgi:hypothetical protein